MDFSFSMCLNINGYICGLNQMFNYDQIDL